MPPSIEYSIFVKNDFHIEAYRGKKKIIVCDILIQNFSFTLSKFLSLFQSFNEGNKHHWMCAVNLSRSVKIFLGYVMIMMKVKVKVINI